MPKCTYLPLYLSRGRSRGVCSGAVAPHFGCAAYTQRVPWAEQLISTGPAGVLHTLIDLQQDFCELTVHVMLCRESCWPACELREFTARELHSWSEVWLCPLFPDPGYTHVFKQCLSGWIFRSANSHCCPQKLWVEMLELYSVPFCVWI